jgi:hypothetical protein
LFDRLFEAKLLCAAGFRSHVSIIAAVAARARLSFDRELPIGRTQRLIFAAAGCYSAQCVPNMVPDFSDQLTEAEVAEPGFNSGEPAGGGGRH